MKKVLIAEDSSVIQNLTKKILQFQNYEIDSVKNGLEVINYLETKTPDVILLDINMPVMNGLECIKKIREMDDELKSKIPVIAITGNSANYTVDFLKGAGFDEFLPKPINFDVLVDTVKKYSNE
ncbi:MAG: response regulator [Cytophagales bacterium]|jgi:two-component system, cell cycle response regulator DivK